MAGKTKTATERQSSVVITGALTVALDRAGGVLEFTDAELAEIRARRRGEVITTTIDRSKPGPPVIRVALEQGDQPIESDPVN